MLYCEFESYGEAQKCARCGRTVRSKAPNLVAACKQQTDGGPGTELKHLLKRFGFATCGKCGRRSQIMDQRGPDWCRDNIDTIVGWLREAAADRKLPFSATLAKMLIRKAINGSVRVA